VYTINSPGIGAASFTLILIYVHPPALKGLKERLAIFFPKGASLL